ncbi:hypothetical protein AB204_17660 [Xenorhabdus khoisanae]|uniref:Abi-like protein n=1 Tax=Xenorhabdus khoisanae TaxID=880157 RepID=A0A0J5FNH9_9GAMM|nr:hypothetical protein [Xenorhabdus khoisanae]KMJ43828.1 hypothetical protein AB204_17660 [Xenorhabdus khoisanae]
MQLFDYEQIQNDGFWPKILDVKNDKKGNPVPWDLLIPRMLPYHRYRSPDYWKKRKHQDQLYGRLEMIGSLRNRIAHFEPIWKQGDLYEEIRYRQNKQRNLLQKAPVDIIDSLSRLNLIHDNAQELLGWLSKSRLKSYKNSYVYDQLNWLLSNNGVETYLQQRTLLKISKTEFKRNLTGIIRKKQPIVLIDKGNVLGRYFPSY